MQEESQHQAICKFLSRSRSCLSIVSFFTGKTEEVLQMGWLHHDSHYRCSKHSLGWILKISVVKISPQGVMVSSLFSSYRSDRLNIFTFWFSQCLSRALRNENPKLLMAASAVLLPIQPLMVSVVHTGMMEVICCLYGHFILQLIDDMDLQLSVLLPC